MLKVIGYVRVSTEEQSKEGVSLDAQKAKVAAYCALYDLELVEVVIDAGVSAKTLKRPGLQAALQMLKAGKADGLVVCKLDRLSRSVKDWNTLIEGYFGEKAGRQLFSVADSIDTRTAAGRLVLNVLMSVSQWEREAIGERTKDAMGYKRTQGQRISRTTFGFDVAADGITLVENVEEQSIITKIRALHADGFSLRQIAEHLDELGVSPKEGGRRWTHQAVSGILKRAS